MIYSASCIKYCTVAETDPGSLVIFFAQGSGKSGEWLACLSVKHGDAVTLLALNFGDGAGRSPFLLEDIAKQNCLQLGKAEFRFTYPNPIASSPGHLILGSSGAAIIGRVSAHGQMPTEKSWLILTGEATDIDRAALRPAGWEVGVINAGIYEKVLSFPFTT